MTLGIDVACRAAHQASLADESGRFLWSGRRFKTTAADLEQLWQAIPAGAAVTIVMEPTRNAWVLLAVWFRRRGANDTTPNPDVGPGSFLCPERSHGGGCGIRTHENTRAP
jgi:Transposase